MGRAQLYRTIIEALAEAQADAPHLAEVDVTEDELTAMPGEQLAAYASALGGALALGGHTVLLESALLAEADEVSLEARRRPTLVRRAVAEALPMHVPKPGEPEDDSDDPMHYREFDQEILPPPTLREAALGQCEFQHPRSTYNREAGDFTRRCGRPAVTVVRRGEEQKRVCSVHRYDLGKQGWERGSARQAAIGGPDPLYALAQREGFRLEGAPGGDLLKRWLVPLPGHEMRIHPRRATPEAVASFLEQRSAALSEPGNRIAAWHDGSDGLWLDVVFNARDRNQALRHALRWGQDAIYDAMDGVALPVDGSDPPRARRSSKALRLALLPSPPDTMRALAAFAGALGPGIDTDNEED